MKARSDKIITLTTDFGLSDPYVASMKGVILSINPKADIVDITHDIPPQDVIAAALALKACVPYFPTGSIHVAVVDPGVGGSRRAIVARNKRTYFVGPDNGILTEFLDGADVHEITSKRFVLKNVSNTFHGRDIFAPAAAHLSKGALIKQFGPKVSDPVLTPLPELKKQGRDYVGEIISIDRFGNLVTNIPGELLHKGKKAVVSIRNKRIAKTVKSYSEAKRGELVAIVGSLGLIEISASMADAAKKLKAKKGDKVALKI